MKTLSSVSPKLLLSVVIFGLLIGFTIILLFSSPDWDRLSSLGYLGVFLANLIGSAALVLQFPVGVVIVAAGRTLDPFLVAVVAGIGSGLGELTAYYGGYTGNLVFEKQIEQQQRIQTFVHRWGAISIFVLAVIPNPIYDFAGIAAGLMRLGVLKFLIATILGRSIKAYILATAGSLIFV